MFLAGISLLVPAKAKKRWIPVNDCGDDSLGEFVCEDQPLSLIQPTVSERRNAGFYR